MNDSRKPAGLILSAGFSSRMKEFKPLMKIGEKNSLEILIHNMRISGIEDIFVVIGYNAEFIGENLKNENVKLVMNENYADGMFTSIKAGIKAAMENGNDCVVMTPVDIPLIPPYIIKTVLARHEENPGYFVVPCYEGKKGHPLCIPSDFYEEILSSDGENGLKSVTSKHEDRFIRIDTHCEGIVIDMDTQEAYKKLLQFYNENKYPSEEKCWKILNRMETPAHVVRHCVAVRDTAVAITEALNAHGKNFSVPLVNAAGLLHDVLRVKKKHWEEGAKLAMDYGYPEVADIIEAHMNYIPKVPVYEITEKDILCLSDKLRQEDRLVTLDERLEPIKKRWEGDPEAQAVIEMKISAADECMKFIEEIIGESVYEMLRENDRKKAELESAGPKQRRIILVRHGDILKHKDKIMLGQKDVGISVEGKEQCTHVGLELQHFDVETDTVYCSDLNRAKESARIITRILGDSYHMVEVPEFREMNLGHWDGMFISDIQKQYPEEYKARGLDLINYKIDDEAENFVELQQRAMKKLDEIIFSTEGDIIIVSHSGVLRTIKCALTGKPLEAIVKMKFGRGTYEFIELPVDYSGFKG